jgi:hypothetical protein
MILSDNFYFKSLNIPSIEHINAEIKLYDQNREPTVGFAHVDNTLVLNELPILNKWFNEHNMIIERIAVITIKSNSIQSPHVDQGTQSLAINFPLQHCNDTWTRFFKNTGTVVKKVTPDTKIPYLAYIDNNMQEDTRYELTGPTLINIKKPHSVMNKTNFDRSCISFRFKEDPWFLLEDQNNE